MIVRHEQENVNPRAQFKSPSSRCMVLREPSSVQSFPGMEHDRGLYNGLSQQDVSPDRISGIIATSDVFKDKKEKESVPAPTLSPLQISISERSEVSAAPSRESELSSNGSTKHRSFQIPSRNPREFHVQRPSSGLSSAPIIMGPPTNSSGTQVLLSPAGNLHNGIQRMPSGDSAPSSPGLYSRVQKGLAHPLAVPRVQPPHRLSSNPSLGPTTTVRPASSATSPQNTRKEHEMTRRRALVDRIARAKSTEFVHLMPKVAGLTTTQTSILLRKNRGALQQHGMPYSMQQMIDCGAAPDKTTENFVKKIKDANHKRTLGQDLDELTDMSDLEDDLDEMRTREDVKIHHGGTWTIRKMDYVGLVRKVDAILEEKRALHGMLELQSQVMDKSCGVRYEGEELITRRRRQLNGTYYLYDKTPLHRIPARNFGCSRVMPIQSWTARKPLKNVFDAKREIHTGAVSIVKPTNPGEKWIATAQYNPVSHLVTGEKREVVEYDYEEYRIGQGMQQVNELSFKDPLEFVASGYTNPFSNRVTEYMYQMATGPSNVVRKKFDRASYYDTDVRKRIADKSASKIAANKKKLRKRPLEEESSDEETSETRSAAVAKKRSARGRPSTSAPAPKKKYHKPVTAADMDPKNGIYMDYLFEDFMGEEICLKMLPSKAVAYAKITCPGFHRHREDLWDQQPGPSNEPAVSEESEDLYMTVAKQHHRLRHTEKERQKDDRKSRRMSKIKAAAAAAGNSQLDADGFPPFDMSFFEPRNVFSARNFSSVAEPWEQRDFINNPPVIPPTELTNK